MTRTERSDQLYVTCSEDDVGGWWYNVSEIFKDAHVHRRQLRWDEGDASPNNYPEVRVPIGKFLSTFNFCLSFTVKVHRNDGF